MATTLSVLLKNELILDQSLTKVLVEEDADRTDVKIFKHRPQNKGTTAHVYYDTQPFTYRHDHERFGTSVDSLIYSAREHEITMPDALIQKAQREGRFLNADGELHRILQEAPQLERLRRYQPLWGFAKFTEGKPAHYASLVAGELAPRDVVDSMTYLAQFLATKYNGIVWDASKGRFGKPRKQFGNIGYDSFDPRAVGWSWSSIFPKS